MDLTSERVFRKILFERESFSSDLCVSNHSTEVELGLNLNVLMRLIQTRTQTR
jgi:hypothetical protein